LTLPEVHWQFASEFGSVSGCVLCLQVDVLSWISAKHNMGMAFDRTTWNQIKACAAVRIVGIVCVSFVCLFVNTITSE